MNNLTDDFEIFISKKMFWIMLEELNTELRENLGDVLHEELKDKLYESMHTQVEDNLDAEFETMLYRLHFDFN